MLIRAGANSAANAIKNINSASENDLTARGGRYRESMYAWNGGTVKRKSAVV